MRQALVAAGMEPTSSDMSMVAANEITLDEADVARKVMRLIDALDEHDDVDAVYSNADVSDEIMNQLAKE